jgi:IS5 family transposase
MSDQLSFSDGEQDVRAKGEHGFRVVKPKFGSTKMRYRGLSKNKAQLRTLFVLANLWMARRELTNSR